MIKKFSPYFNNGRQGSKINMIIIHSTEGGYKASVDWLCNPARAKDPNDGGTSAHYVIKEDGKEITQLVDDTNTAWHAGNWDYNIRSIGIEHTWVSRKRQGNSWVQPDVMPSDELYRAGANLTATLCLKYGIPMDRQHIIGHEAVPPPNDHTDPNEFWDWDKFMQMVGQEAAIIGPAGENNPDPNPNKLNVGVGVLAKLKELHKVAFTTEQFYSPDPGQNGLGRRSFTWDTEGSVYVAFQDVDAAGNLPGTWTVQVFKV